MGTFLATIDGTSGNDAIYSGAGSDEFNLFGGDDLAEVGGGNDTVNAGDGNDSIDGGFGDDTLYGGAGNDTLDGSNGNDSLYGGDGSDIIIEGSGAGYISGDAGEDFIYAGEGNDTVYGGAGNDDIQGEFGDDMLYGDDGADVFRLSSIADNDTIFGGAGGSDFDTIEFIGVEPVIVTFTGDELGGYTQTGGTTQGTFTDIENIVTANGNDTINASSNSALLQVDTGSGNDTINSGSGDDFIQYGAGSDIVYGGGGNDFIDDMGDSSSGENSLYGGSGNDTIFGASDNDTIYGGSGDDRIYGEVGADQLYGDSGNDTLFGGTGDDQMFGGDGSDTLYGGGGNDTLQGGSGDDTLSGGSGNDTFGFSRFGGTDTVVDFDINDDDSNGFYNDQLDVSALRTLGGDPVTRDDVVVDDDGFGNARLTFPEGEVIILQGVTVAQMSSPAQQRAAGIPCFTVGTQIMTPNGNVQIETLRPGDMVTTRDNGPQAVVWIGQRHVGHQELRANPNLRPIRISAGLYANENPLLISPQHGVLLQASNGSDQQLVRAAHLERLHGGKVRVAFGVREVTYVHVLFEKHQVVFTDGVASESFYPGPWALRSLRRPEMRELAQLFPVLGRSGVAAQMGATARPFARFWQLPKRLSGLTAPRH